jgi:hypothetical protein
MLDLERSCEFEFRRLAIKVVLILDEWILLEYSFCYLGVQQNATAETVSKSLSPEFAKALGLEISSAQASRSSTFCPSRKSGQRSERNDECKLALESVDELVIRGDQFTFFLLG